jgi:hypothetical protein
MPAQATDSHVKNGEHIQEGNLCYIQTRCDTNRQGSTQALLTSLAVGRSSGAVAVQAWMRCSTSAGHSSGTAGSGRLPRVTGMMPVTICPRTGRGHGPAFSQQGFDSTRRAVKDA